MARGSDWELVITFVASEGAGVIDFSGIRIKRGRIEAFKSLLAFLCSRFEVCTIL